MHEETYEHMRHMSYEMHSFSTLKTSHLPTFQVTFPQPPFLLLIRIASLKLYFILYISKVQGKNTGYKSFKRNRGGFEIGKKEQVNFGLPLQLHF